MKFFTTLIILLSVQSLSAQSLRQPAKYLDAELTMRAPANPRFTEQDVISYQFIDIKNAEWEACHQSNIFNSILAESVDPIRKFVESETLIENLQIAEQLHLQAGRVEKIPWSGDYWPYSNGILATRYMDAKFNQLQDWQQKFEYVRSLPASQVLQNLGQQGANILSTSEKYDLLVGDPNYGQTELMWQQGKEYFDNYGKVEKWMGICHGWAPAAMVEPGPQKAVDIPSQDGQWSVHLNPSEIKGLISYSWATNPYHSMNLGGRCNEKNPTADEHGRIIDPDCFDLNPATWHLAIINRLGLQKRSFIMDATYDYEVWNQPVTEYSYTYFNPQTMTKEKNLQSATVTRAEFSKDRFSRFRSNQAEKVVGIRMKVAFVIETSSSALDEEPSEQNAIRWVEYAYDLELDKNDKVIGGEWYIQAHPDFIWTPRKNATPKSPLDKHLNPLAWNGVMKLPNDWAEVAKYGSSKGLMLHTIPKAVLEKSRAN